MGPTGRTDDRIKKSFQGVKFEIAPFNICSTSKIANTPFNIARTQTYLAVKNGVCEGWLGPGHGAADLDLLVQHQVTVVERMRVGSENKIILNSNRLGT